MILHPPLKLAQIANLSSVTKAGLNLQDAVLFGQNNEASKTIEPICVDKVARQGPMLSHLKNPKG